MPAQPEGGSARGPGGGGYGGEEGSNLLPPYEVARLPLSHPHVHDIDDPTLFGFLPVKSTCIYICLVAKVFIAS